MYSITRLDQTLLLPSLLLKVERLTIDIADDEESKGRGWVRGWVSEWGVKLLSYVNRVPPFSSALLLDLCAIAVCVCVCLARSSECSGTAHLHSQWAQLNWLAPLFTVAADHFHSHSLTDCTFLRDLCLPKKNLLFLSSFYSDELSTVVHCRFIFIFSGLNIQRPVKGHEHKRGKMFSTLDFCISGLFFTFSPISHSLFPPLRIMTIPWIHNIWCFYSYSLIAFRFLFLSLCKQNTN